MLEGPYRFGNSQRSQPDVLFQRDGAEPPSSPVRRRISADLLMSNTQRNRAVQKRVDMLDGFRVFQPAFPSTFKCNRD